MIIQPLLFGTFGLQEILIVFRWKEDSGVNEGTRKGSPLVQGRYEGGRSDGRNEK